MNCPNCGSPETRVRRTDGDHRKRECTNCRHRWTTVEVHAARFEAAEAVAGMVRDMAKRLGEPA